MTLFDPNNPLHKIIAERRKLQELMDKAIPRSWTGAKIIPSKEVTAVEPVEYKPSLLLRVRAWCVKWSPLTLILTIVGAVFGAVQWLWDHSIIQWLSGLAGR